MSSPFQHMWPASYPALYQSPNRILRAALESLPGYPETTTALGRISDAVDQAGNQPTTSGGLRDQLVTSILTAADSGPVSVTDVLAEARSIEQDDRTLLESRTALVTAGRRLVENVDRIVERNKDSLLVFAHDELQRLLARARSGVIYTATAEQAITSGRIDAFTATAEWVIEYKEIRAAQRLLMAKLGGLEHFTDARLPGLTFHNVIGVFPQYAEWVVEGGYVSAPFPNLSWAGDQAPIFKWCADHPEAQPWVPTTTQYAAYTEALEGEVSRYVSEKRRGGVARLVEADR